MEKVPILTQLKLLGYFWVALGGVLIGNIVYWNIYQFIPLPKTIVILFGSITSLIGVFYMIKILTGHKKRCKTYIKLYNRFSENIAKGENLHTYQLYVIRQTLCGSVVVRQLCKDFNIKL